MLLQQSKLRAAEQVRGPDTAQRLNCLSELMPPNSMCPGSTTRREREAQRLLPWAALPAHVAAAVCCCLLLHPPPPSTHPHTHTQVYLEDLAELPENPWALKGLAQVYAAQGPAAAAKRADVSVVPTLHPVRCTSLRCCWQL